MSRSAHCGIVNILYRYRDLYHCWPDAVINGFHMMKKSGCTERDRYDILRTAEILNGLPTRFYTGHCTGAEAFSIMKSVMGEKLEALQTGQTLELSREAG